MSESPADEWIGIQIAAGGFDLARLPRESSSANRERAAVADLNNDGLLDIARRTDQSDYVGIDIWLQTPR